MNKKEIIQAIKDRKQYQELKKEYPLAVSSLWSPYCYNWNMDTNRKSSCKVPMYEIGDGVYKCPSCGIEEERTSQRRAAKLFGQYNDSFCLLGGNRSGKTEIGAQLITAICLSSSSWITKAWLSLNDLPASIIPNDAPTTAISSGLSYGDCLGYIRPKITKYLPVGCRFIRWTSQDRATCIFPNGSKIISLSADSGRKRYQGFSGVSFGWIDEECEKPIYDELMLRCVDAGKKSSGVFLSLTPLLGFSWVHDVFINDDTNADGVGYYKITGLDNPYISSKKMMNTVAHMSKEQQASRLFGHFTAQSGLVYPEFDIHHHVVKPFDLPSVDDDYYAFDIGIDFGVSAPFGAVLGLWDHRKNMLFIVDEYKVAGKTSIENGNAIKRKWSKYAPFRFVICDPNDKNARILLAKNCGLHNKPAPKSQGVGPTINQVKELLAKDAAGNARLKIFSSCRNLIREFKQYKWNNNRTGKDAVIKKNDHLLDALRYLVIFLHRYNQH